MARVIVDESGIASGEPQWRRKKDPGDCGDNWGGLAGVHSSQGAGGKRSSWVQVGGEIGGEMGERLVLSSYPGFAAIHSQGPVDNADFSFAFGV